MDAGGPAKGSLSLAKGRKTPSDEPQNAGDFRWMSVSSATLEPLQT